MADNGDIYIACSQSYNKNREIPDIRKLLLRIKRDRTILKLDKQIYLYHLLKEASERDKTAGWSQFMTSGGQDLGINIEGIFYHEGDLYPGFKRPLNESKAVILKINNIDKVLGKA